MRPGNIAPYEMLQRWRAVGNTESDLTSRRFGPQTSRSRDERVIARPTGLRCFEREQYNLWHYDTKHLPKYLNRPTWRISCVSGFVYVL